MSNIRRQSIISSVVIYIGFAIGLLNIYLFTRQGLSANDHFTDATIWIIQRLYCRSHDHDGVCQPGYAFLHLQIFPVL